MILSTEFFLSPNSTPPTSYEKSCWGEPAPSQVIPCCRLRIALILIADVAALMLDVLEDAAAGWTAETRLASLANFSVSFF